ncbi:DedA family protein [Corynebacterium choanae]|uniref:SNARE associated Golgi protein n=1 Tax=Corynebacterium choanae TaxID=1862358 RepID=A0A3G6J8G7_9CORY|nr:VTT domain-containing protein [Corynebacterium choanae]AZA14391.1 SNARE associated Golgi protein [Corynebacterium choanae]
MTRTHHSDDSVADPAGSPTPETPAATNRPDQPPLPEFFTSPDKIDIWLFIYLGVNTLFNLAIIPLRVWLMNRPVIYALMVGGYTSAILGGAQSSLGGTAAWIVVVCALVGALKGVPLWWLIGHKWGMEYIEMLAGQSKSMRKWLPRLQNLSPRLLLGVTLLSYIPFMPTLLVANLLSGVRGIRFSVVMAVNALGVLIRNSIFAYLGIRYGEAVIGVVDEINKYATWITLVLIAVAIYSATKSAKHQRPAKSA